jgi:hypothetical protein
MLGLGGAAAIANKHEFAAGLQRIHTAINGFDQLLLQPAVGKHIFHDLAGGHQGDSDFILHRYSFCKKSEALVA